MLAEKQKLITWPDVAVPMSARILMSSQSSAGSEPSKLTTPTHQLELPARHAEVDSYARDHSPI